MGERIGGGKWAPRAWIVAITLAVIALLSAFGSALVPAAAMAILFLAVAAGIRRKQSWAAVAGAVPILLPLALLASREISREMTVWLIVSATVAIAGTLLFAAAARELSREHRQGANRYAWMATIGCYSFFVVSVQSFVIPTGVMEETILIGDHLWVEKLSRWARRPVSRNDIVAFRYPIVEGQAFVQRVVGVPGDRIRIDGKRLFVNGQMQEEAWARNKTDYVDSYRDNFPGEPNVRLFQPALDMLANYVRDREVVVPDGHYFVMGDNRDSALDSRYWGFLPAGNIIGKPIVIYESREPGEERDPVSGPRRWARILKWL